MGSTKFKLECFNGKGDFLLWKEKLKEVFVQQRVARAIEDPSKWPEDFKKKTDEIEEMNSLAYSTIYLHLSYIVMRQVTSITTPLGLWKKLDELYAIKNLPNKIYLLKRFFGFKMNLSKDLDVNHDEFNKITMALMGNGENFRMNTLLFERCYRIWKSYYYF